MKKWTNLLLFSALVVFGACNSNSDPNEQINKELLAIDTYLTTYMTAHSDEKLIYDNYGERIVIQNFGSGLIPHAGQNVKVTYTARLFPDNTVFDSGIINDKIDNISIGGLKIGISYLMQGTDATIYIPSQNAFAETGSTNANFLTAVPPNTSIVYQVSLDTVTRTTTERTQFKLDSTAINKFIVDNKITNVVFHPSGFWYANDSSGTVPRPNVYEKVDFDYEGLTLDNKTFDTGKITNTTLLFLGVDGLKIGIPLMKKGDKATFYIPSGLAYGPNGTTGIAANAPLIFKVTLDTIYSN